jgi:hypothetical protein
MDNKWVWIGFGALVLVFILARQRGSAQVIAPGSDPDLADMERSRFDFAARGLDSLTSLLSQEKEYERDLSLGRMALERDVALGRFSLERDVSVAAAQERAATAQANAYLVGALAHADNQRYAEGQVTKRSWIDALGKVLSEYGDEIVGAIFGGNKPAQGFGGSGTFTGQPVYRPVPIGQPTFGR